MGIYKGVVLLRGWLLEAEGAMTEKRSEGRLAGALSGAEWPKARDDERQIEVYRRETEDEFARRGHFESRTLQRCCGRTYRP